MPPPNVRRIFCGWNAPLVVQAAELLGPAEVMDFSRVLAVVPTRQAGRRLREELARRAAYVGKAVFPPRLVEPEGLLEVLGEARSLSDTRPSASRLECLVAWAEVLLAVDLSSVREVFPVDPPDRTFQWGLRIAQQLLKMQADLAELGLRCADVVDKAAGWDDFPERRRWGELAELETAFEDSLARRGRTNPQTAKRRAALDPVGPDLCARVVMLGVADPLPLAVLALENLAERDPSLLIEVAVFAPEEDAADFDGWGRPLTDRWRARPVQWSNFSTQVHLRADPAGQAGAVAELALRYGGRARSFAVGCADPGVLVALEQALPAAAVPVYNPQGRRRQAEGFYHLVGCLADFMREPSWAAVEATGRCVDVIHFLRRRGGANRFSAARWMAGLDALHGRHLPADLSAGRRHAPDLSEAYSELVPGLSVLDDLRRAGGTGGFASGVSAVLAEIFAGRRVDLCEPDGEALAESTAAWMDVVRQCAVLETGASLSPDDWWDLALRLFGESRRFEDKPADAVELQGWIELLWEDAPHLVVAGLNEGSVPGAHAGDPFLPEKLRERLGLKTADDRLARDAYLLQAIAASRGRAGRLDVLVGKASAQGDPLQPSRLLLQCEPHELPGRVQLLFRSLPAAGSGVPWRRAWQLTPPSPAAGFPQRLAVTALKAWLACPFRFFLRHGLKMEAVDPGKSEMDPADFGTLCHGALQAMGEEPRLHDCADPQILRDFLLARLEERVRETFGSELALPLIIQVESARQRLRRAAELQAREQWSGWRIVAVERKITVVIAGITVVARVDRIDRHQDTGAVRVIDYKTADAAVAPAAAHLRVARKDDIPRSGTSWIDGQGRTCVWQDLQLPLYRHALAAEFPELQACGYFNLPKAVGDSVLSWWEDYSPDLHASAIACAETVCAAIAAGEFWPPNPKVRPAVDDYFALFHHGAAESVQWKGRR